MLPLPISSEFGGFEPLSEMSNILLKIVIICKKKNSESTKVNLYFITYRWCIEDILISSVGAISPKSGVSLFKISVRPNCFNGLARSRCDLMLNFGNLTFTMSSCNWIYPMKKSLTARITLNKKNHQLSILKFWRVKLICYLFSSWLKKYYANQLFKVTISM